MRITALVVVACATTSAAARPGWRAQIVTGAPEKPRALEAVVVPTVVYETAELRAAQRLLDDGFFAAAVARLSRVILDSHDAREVCRARILVLRAIPSLGRRSDLRAAVIALAARLRSRRSDDDCRREGDALVGDFALMLDLESDELDPLTLVPLWDAEAAIATTAARRAMALHDRAIDFWRRASSGVAGATEWLAAEAAAEQAVAADPTDDDMSRRAGIARWNAALCVRNSR